MKPLFAAVVLVVLACGAYFFISSGSSADLPDSDPSVDLIDGADEDGPDLEAGSRGEAEGGREASRGASRAASGGTEGAMRVGDGARLRVRLRLAGRGLEAARLRLCSPDGRPAEREARQERSDREGRLALGGLPTGRFRIAVTHADVPRRWRSEVFTLESARELDLGTLDIPAAGGFRGRIVDEQQRAIADARVAFVAAGLFGFEEGGVANSVQSARDGRFELLRVEAGKRALLVQHAKFRSLARDFELEAGDYIDVGDLVLKEGRRVTGSVVDTNGKAIVGAELTPQETASLDGRETSFFARGRSVATDRGGRFSLEGLPDVVRLRVRAEGFAEKIVDVAADALQTRVVLSKSAGIAGVVRGHRRGFPTRIHVERLRDTLRRSVLAEADGSFAVSGLRPGRYSIVADSPGVGSSPRRAVDVPEAGLRGLELRLVGGCTLELSVLGADDRPVSGATVRVVSREGGVARRGTTDARGQLSFRQLWPGDATLRVSAGEARHEKALTLPPRGTRRETLRLGESQFVEGRVVDDLGRAAAGAQVQLRAVASSGGAPSPAAVLADGDGRFRIGPLSDGAYRIWASWPKRGALAGVVNRLKKNALPAKAETITVQRGRLPSPVLRLARPAVLRGVVRFQGRPMPGARVIVHRDGARGVDLLDLPEARCDDQGKYELAGLVAGTWWILAKPAGGKVPSAKARVVLQVGEQKLQDIAIRGGAVEGKVVPVGSARVDFTKLEVFVHAVGTPGRTETRVQFTGSSSASTSETSLATLRSASAPDPVRPDAAGGFRFDFVPAGSWLVTVYEGRTQRGQRQFDLRDGELLRLGKLRLVPTYPVQLRLVDDTGARVDTAQFALFRKDAVAGGKGQRVFSKLVSGGLAKIASLEVGDYVVEMRPVVNGKPGSLQTGTLTITREGRVQASPLRVAR